jgi:hypothetical protein
MSLSAFALDVIPSHVSASNPDTLGLYQLSGEAALYKKPDEKSQVIDTLSINNTAPDAFVVHIPAKDLAFLAVSDETEDWLQIIYNNNTGAKGWIKKDDPYKFLSWVNFFNTYGKKYGLVILNSAPAEVNNLYSAPDEFSQVLGRINHPQKINLNAIRGNWALVSVYDLDKVPKTGFIRWRADNGVKYLFPALN